MDTLPVCSAFRIHKSFPLLLTSALWLAGHKLVLVSFYEWSNEAQKGEVTFQKSQIMSNRISALIQFS